MSKNTDRKKASTRSAITIVMEISIELINSFIDGEDSSHVISKFKELYHNEDPNLLHCFAAHFSKWNLMLDLQRTPEMQLCAHGSCNPLTTVLGDQSMIGAAKCIEIYGWQIIDLTCSRKFKGVFNGNLLMDKAVTAWDIILGFDNIDMLKIIMKEYRGHLFPIYKMAKAHKASACQTAIKLDMEDIWLVFGEDSDDSIFEEDDYGDTSFEEDDIDDDIEEIPVQVSGKKYGLVVVTTEYGLVFARQKNPAFPLGTLSIVCATPMA